MQIAAASNETAIGVVVSICIAVIALVIAVIAQSLATQQRVKRD
jgi:hypothetical protein